MTSEPHLLGACGRADLALALEGVPDADRAEVAALLGFDLVARPRPELEPAPPEPALQVGMQVSIAAAVEAAPSVGFWRLEGIEYFEEPEHVEPPELEVDEDLLFGDYLRRPAPEIPPIAAWARLEPHLWAMLATPRPSRRLDVPRLLRAWGRAERMRSLPFVPALRWPRRLHVLEDRRIETLPLWADQDGVIEGLEARVGREGLVRHVISGAAGLDELAPRLAADPGAAVLALSDLGADGLGRDRRAWSALAHRLGQAPRRVGALWVQPAVEPKARAVRRRWRARPWAGRGPLPGAVAEEGEARLLELCAIAAEIEPGLLRRLRRLLPEAIADAATELSVWRGGALRAGVGGAVWRVPEVDRFRAGLLARKDLEQIRAAAGEVQRWHDGPIAPELWLDEVIEIRQLEARLGLPVGDLLPEGQAPRAQRWLESTIGYLEREPDEARHMQSWLRSKLRTRSDAAMGSRGAMRGPKGGALVSRLATALGKDEASGRAGGGRSAKDLAAALRWDEQRRELSVWQPPGRPELAFGQADGSPLVTVPAGRPLLHVDLPPQRGLQIRFDRVSSFEIAPSDLLGQGWPGAQEEPEPVPDWAVSAGRDEFGRWAEVKVFGEPLRLRWIEPGEFWMGASDDDEDAFDHEKPRHHVTLTVGYWMAETPCTQKLWFVVTEKRPSEFEGDDRPVEQVSWDDVAGFIEAVNAAAPGLELRLPTEAQWEYACRAGTEGPRYGPLDEVAWYSGNSKRRTQPVGLKAPNPWGLFDTLGNVYEWCQDRYGTYGPGSVIDPMGPPEGTYRVFRGGSWSAHARGARAALRDHWHPSYRYSNLGFRLSRGPGAPSQAGGQQARRASEARPGERRRSEQGAEPAELQGVRTGLGPSLQDGLDPASEQGAEPFLDLSYVDDGAADSASSSLRMTVRSRSLADFEARYSAWISSAGVFLPAAQPRPVGTKIRFELLLASGARALGGAGVVISLREGEEPGMAVRFETLDPESRATVDRMVEAHGSGALAPPAELQPEPERLGLDAAPARGGVVLVTDRCEARLGVFERPAWASEVGRDKFGLFAEVEVEEAFVSERFRLRWIPPGRFWMGSPEAEEGRWDDEVQHLVTLTEGYWMAETPCTQALWRTVMDTEPSEFKGNLGHPVERVSWEDVQDFLRVLNSRVPGLSACLPTEAQWEHACRAGTEGARYGGLEEVAWYAENSQGSTHPVGLKAPNAWGLYDTLGNVYEWCQDWYGAYGPDSVMNPLGPPEGSHRVFRGGCWSAHARSARAAYRHHWHPSSRDSDLGFRLSRGPGARSPAGSGSMGPGGPGEARAARAR